MSSSIAFVRRSESLVVPSWSWLLAKGENSSCHPEPSLGEWLMDYTADIMMLDHVDHLLLGLV